VRGEPKTIGTADVTFIYYATSRFIVGNVLECISVLNLSTCEAYFCWL